MKTVIQITHGGSSFILDSVSGDGRDVLYGAGINNEPQELLVTDSQSNLTQQVATNEGDYGTDFLKAAVSQDDKFVADVASYSFDGEVTETFNLFDLTTGQNSVVFPNPEGVDNFGNSYVLGISADDQSVFFTSSDPDLIGDPTDDAYDLFQLNVQTGSIQRLLVNSGDFGNADIISVASGGRYIAAFADNASGNEDLYRLDLTTGDIDLIETGDLFATITQSALSADGRYVVFTTNQALLPQDTDGIDDVYLKDLSTGNLSLLSVNASGVAVGGNEASISSDGGRVDFMTSASFVTPGATGYIFVSKALDTGILDVLMDADVFSNADVSLEVSADGNTIAATTVYPILPSDTDKQTDVYLLHFTLPVLTINPIDGNDFDNAADGYSIPVSGTSDAIGKTILLSLPGSQTTTGALVHADGTWSTIISTQGYGDGATDLHAVVTDGYTKALDHPFTIDRTPPADLAITSVAGDNIINAAEVTHALVLGTVLVADPSGTGTDIGTLTLSIDGGKSTTLNTPASTTLTDAVISQDLDASGVADGEHTITLTATDPAGNTATVTKQVLVDTTPPKIAITAVSGDDVVDSTEIKSNQGVRGTSDAIGATVDVLLDGVEAGQAVVQADGSWLTTVSFAGTITGEHDVTANVSDEAGNPGRADAGVYVDRGFSVQQLSEGPNGEQGGGSGVMFPSLSADGTELVFTGVNFNLLSTAAGSSGTQVYIKNLTTGAISFATPVSSENSEFGAISPDGTKIVFVSNAPLDPTTQQSIPDPDGYYAYEESLADGVPHFRAFDSQNPDALNFQLPGGKQFAEPNQTFPLSIANNGYDSVVNLSTNGSGSAVQVFENIVVDGAVTSDGQPASVYNELETLTPTPFPAIGTYQAYAPEFSADGSVVAIEVNLHAEQSTTTPRGTNFEIYAGSTNPSSYGHIPLASSDSNGNALPFGAVDPALSQDGKFVAFWSWDDAGDLEVFRKNLTTGELDVVSTDTIGNAGVNNASGTFAGGFDTIAISADGRYVAFTSDAVLTPDDSGTSADLFVKDMQTGTIQRLDLPAGTFANDLSTQLAMAQDGQYIVFTTPADLSPMDRNNAPDIYGVSLSSFGTPPQIAIGAVAGDDRINAAEVSNSVVISGTSDAIGQTVTLAIDGGILPGVVVGADGTWSSTIDATGLADGVHQLRATVSASNGASDTDGDLITVDTVAPTVVLSADNTNLAPDQTATISARFSEGIGNVTPGFMSATGGTLSDFEFVDDHTATELFTPTSGATAYSVAINPGGFFDYAGNPNISGASLDLSESGAAGPIVSGAGQSAVITSGQTSSGVVVESGGTIIVSSGGTSLDTIVSSGGTLIVQPGGFADPTVVSSGGTEIVSATGTDLGALVQNGGLQIVHGTVSGVTVSGGGEQYIGADGTSLAAQVQAGGAEVVFGTDSGASLSGTQYDFATASGGTTLNGGYQLVAPGAFAVGMTVAFGGQQYVGMGGTTLAAQVASGGAEVVFGTDSGASLSGTQYLYGTANGGTTFNGGYQLVASGATVSGMTVSSGGYQYIGSGGTAMATNIAAQGAQIVFGSALAALVSGTQYDFAYASGGTTYDNGFQLVAPAATAIGMTVSSGGEQYIGAGGTALATDIGAQGAEVIFGSDSGALVSGTQYVFGVASGGTTFDGGYQLVGPAGAGTAIGMTVLAGGQQYVVGGGTASGTELMSQGVEIVHGTDLNATISGTQYVYGLASGTVVGTGGYQLVSADGTISAASISGGTIELMSGAVTGTAPITFTGAGQLLLDASTTFSGTVANFGSASVNDTIDFADIPYVSAGSASATTLSWTQLTSGANASGTLMVSGGGHVADITLLGQYAVGNFNPSSDGHGGTLVTDPPLATATDLSPMPQLASRHA